LFLHQPLFLFAGHSNLIDVASTIAPLEGDDALQRLKDYRLVGFFFLPSSCSNIYFFHFFFFFLFSKPNNSGQVSKIKISLPPSFPLPPKFDIQPSDPKIKDLAHVDEDLVRGTKKRILSSSFFFLFFPPLYRSFPAAGHFDSTGKSSQRGLDCSRLRKFSCKSSRCDNEDSNHLTINNPFPLKSLLVDSKCHTPTHPHTPYFSPVYPFLFLLSFGLFCFILDNAFDFSVTKEALSIIQEVPLDAQSARTVFARQESGVDWRGATDNTKFSRWNTFHLACFILFTRDLFLQLFDERTQLLSLFW
jgi:hypothetical protein